MTTCNKCLEARAKTLRWIAIAAQRISERAAKKINQAANHYQEQADGRINPSIKRTNPGH